MKKLYTTTGATEVSVAGDTYQVKDGAVEVPASAVNILTGSHGFTENSPHAANKFEEDAKAAAEAPADEQPAKAVGKANGGK